MKIIAIASLAILGTVLAASAQDSTKPAEKKKPDHAAAFAKKDTNKDGALSKEEATAGAKDPAKAAAAFEKKDANKDGKLSLEEFSPKPKTAGDKAGDKAEK